MHANLNLARFMLPTPTLAKNTLKKLPEAIDAAPVFL